MRFHEFGSEDGPCIMLIHGGGNAWWNYLRQARVLSERHRYRVVLPTLDGHGEECAEPYVSTEDETDKLLAYIDERCGGRVFALGGVSLGGQIVMELLSRRPDVAEKAVIDGSLCIPQPFMARCCIAFMRTCYGLMFGEKACRRQIEAMRKSFPENMQYPDDLVACYLRDMPRLPKRTMIAIYRTYMQRYALKESVRETHAQVMYWYGEKEMKCVKESARLFQTYVPAAELYEAKGYDHGYLSIYLPDEWLERALPFFERDAKENR